MIKKFSAAVKKMAQRAMMRDNIGQAEIITSLGEHGAKDLLRHGGTPLSTPSQNMSTGVHGVVVDQNVRDVKKDLQHGGRSTSSQGNQVDKKLGGSILDALQ